MKNKKCIFLVFFIIATFILSMLYLNLSKNNKDEFIVEIAFDNSGNSYTLSYDEKYMYLKKINKDQKIEWCNKEPLSEGYEVTGKSNIVVTPEGKAITYTYIYNSQTYKKVSEQIYIYSEDGSKKTLLLNDTMDAGKNYASFFSMNYNNGALYYSQEMENEPHGKQVADVKKIDLDNLEKIKEPELIKTFDYDADIGILKIICMKDGSIIFSTFNSDIFMVKAGAYKQIYSSKQTNKEGKIEYHKITNLAYDDDNIYFLDTLKNQVLTWNVKQESLKLIYDNKILNSLGMDYGEIDRVKFIDSNKFYAIFSNNKAKNNEIAIYDNGQVTKYEKVAYSVKYLVSEALKLEGIIILIVVSLFLVIYAIRKWTNSKLTVSLKQILIVIPVISFSLIFMVQKCDNILKGIVESQFLEQIYQISCDKLQLISGENVKSIDWNFPYNDKNYLKLKEQLDFSENNYKEDNLDTNINGTHNSLYAVVYPVRGGNIYSGICSYNYVNIPIDFIYNDNDMLKYKNCMEKKEFVYTSLKDFEGEWIEVLSPILDNDGNVAAILEIGISKQGFINNMISNNLKEILATNSVISIITIFVLLMGLHFLLKPLKRLKEGVLNIQNGNLGTHVKITGNDEISDISKVFNIMSDNLKNEMDKLTKINEAYYRFVPQQMFELLNKKDVLDINIGDQMKIEIVLMCMTTNNFNVLTDKFSSKDTFQLINKIFGVISKKIYECNGVIERYNNSGLISLYENGSADGIKCAIKIKDTIKKFDDKILSKADIGFFIDKQEIMVGIIGGHNRISASAVSDYLGIMENLNTFGKKFGSSILVTEKAMKEVVDCSEKYNFRKIGGIKYKKQIITVYDFFDGDLNEIINLKEQTKEPFEKGVEYYLNKDFYNARRCFIEVLKVYQSDKAAKEYLILCDEYYKRTDTKNIEIYIAAF